MDRILVTGFEAFGKDSVNPTVKMAGDLPDMIGGYEIHRLILPVSFRRAPETALEALRSLRPAAVVAFGLAGGRKGITVERVAVNCMDARIPDNDGSAPVDEPVVPGGPAAFFSTLPVKKIVEELGKEGIEASISNTAGTFVCNCLMYSLLESLGREGPDIPCGFVHVPYLDSMGHPEHPSMDEETIRRAGETVLKVVAGELGAG